jgi:hypothetical protein
MENFSFSLVESGRGLDKMDKRIEKEHLAFKKFERFLLKAPAIEIHSRSGKILKL